MQVIWCPNEEKFPVLFLLLGKPLEYPIFHRVSCCLCFLVSVMLFFNCLLVLLFIFLSLTLLSAGISLELRAFLCQERLKIPETAKSVELLEPELPTVHKSLEKMAITSGTTIGRSSQNMGIAPNTRTGISLEKMAVAPGTPTGRSSEKMVVAPETPTGGSSEKMVVAPETPTDGSSEKMVVAPETPTCRSPEKRAFAPDTPTGRSSEKMAVAPATPTGRSSETMAIAPDTLTVKSSELIAMTIESPIFLSVPSGSFETPENAHSIAVETLADSYATPEKDLASSKDEDFDLIFMNEVKIMKSCFCLEDSICCHTNCICTQLAVYYLCSLT